jgi:hypothetical protein
MKTIGLCMIVKYDSNVVLRCLESVRPIVDYVLIEDTGSTDGTQTIIRDWLSRVGLSGKVYDQPWQDFGYNRSHALARRPTGRRRYTLLVAFAEKIANSPMALNVPRAGCASRDRPTMAYSSRTGSMTTAFSMSLPSTPRVHERTARR